MKTTAIVILLLNVMSNIKRTNGVNIFGRRLEEDVVKRASATFTINIFLAVSVSAVIMILQPQLNRSDVVFETTSAIGTVGMTTGITRDLSQISRLLIVLLMYCGRIGSLTFALAFTQQKIISPVKQPVGRIIIG